jgi:hypothetical protein
MDQQVKNVVLQVESPAAQVKATEELKQLDYEPLLPVELTLVKWSIGIGVGSLLFLYYLAQWLFPAGH